MKRHSSLLQVPYSENCIVLVFNTYFFILLFRYSRIVEIIIINNNISVLLQLIDQIYEYFERNSVAYLS